MQPFRSQTFGIAEPKNIHEVGEQGNKHVQASLPTDKPLELVFENSLSVAFLILPMYFFSSHLEQQALELQSQKVFMSLESRAVNL